MSNSYGPNDRSPALQLIGQVSLIREYRVQCQCRPPGLRDGHACGKVIHADVHIVRWHDGRVEAWGSTCFSRHFGVEATTLRKTAQFPSLKNRPLTAEERELMKTNLVALIARFEQEYSTKAPVEDRRVKLARDPATGATSEVSGSQVRAGEFDDWNRPWRFSDATRSRRANRPSLVVPASVRPRQTVGELMHDPVWREIYERMEIRWRANGMDPTKGFGRSSLIDNVWEEYRRSDRLGRR